LIKHIEAADEVWHAGDWGDVSVADTIMSITPVKGVYGNIDGAGIRGYFGVETVFECEEVRVGMAHIAGKPGYYKAQGLLTLRNNQVDLFICGHSHILQVQRDIYNRNSFLYINPGAAGREGFHKMMTAIRLKIDGKRIFELEVIELGKRGAIE
jgi:putative phosphoesterase